MVKIPSQSADADSSPLGGAEVLAFPRCGEGGRRSRSDEGYPTGDYSRYVIAMRLFFALISHPRLRSDDSFPTAGEAESLCDGKRKAPLCKGGWHRR